MSFEERVKAEPYAGAFSDCLVDGNAEQNERQRKIKRRALAISISLQTVGLTALVIAPLLAKPAELAMRTVPPMPIYRSAPQPKHDRVVRPIEPSHQVCVPCALISRPPVFRSNAQQNPPIDEPPGTGELPIDPNPPRDGITNIFDPRTQPHVVVDPPPTAHRIKEGHIDPALLVHRVEPARKKNNKKVESKGR